MSLERRASAFVVKPITNKGVLKDPTPQVGCERAIYPHSLGIPSLAVPPMAAHESIDSSMLALLLCRSLEAKEEKEEEDQGGGDGKSDGKVQKSTRCHGSACSRHSVLIFKGGCNPKFRWIFFPDI